MSGPLRALVVDWGGVLTGNLDHAMAEALASAGVDPEMFAVVLRRWLGPEGEAEARTNPLHALERGEVEVPHFEERLADELARMQHAPIDHHGLLQRLFDVIEHAPDMIALVGRARRAGIRTGLLSNSWGNDYPRDGWDDLFDAVVISGEVGMRKPEARIYRHTLDLLGVAAEECVFVDDLRPNVDAAAHLGIVGVHHTDYSTTAVELEALFGMALAR